MIGERRRELLAAGLLALAAAVAWAFVRTYPNHDTYYALVWGRELRHGLSPSYGVDAYSTPHPLWTLVAAACGLIGRGGDRLIVLVCVLAFVALLWGVARLGRAAFGGWGPGIIGAALVGTSSAFLLYAAKGYLDVPFVALVAWAAALEQEKPQRGRSVLILLALAGLLRPEGWLLSLLYLAWLRTHAPAAVALAVVAPVVWALTDLLVTGDPLFSFHATAEIVHDRSQDVSAAGIPKALVTSLADAVRAPVVVLGLIGLALALRRHGVRRLAAPLALALVGTAAFLVSGLLGLSVEPRYLTVPAVATCLFAAYAVLGWSDEPAGTARTWWLRGAVVAGVGALAFALVLGPSTARKVSAETRFVRDSHDEVLALVDLPAVRHCPPIVFPTHQLVPDVRWTTGLGRTELVAAPYLRGRAGVKLYVGPGDKPIRRFGIAAGIPFSYNAPDPKLPEIARRGPFTARGGCA